MNQRDAMIDDLTAAVDRVAGLNLDSTEWDIQAALRWLSSRWRRPARLATALADAEVLGCDSPSLKKFLRERMEARS